MTAWKGAAVALAATLAVSGCQLTGGRASTGEEEPVKASGGRVAPAAPEGKLASRDSSTGATKVRVTLTSLARERNLVTLNFTATTLSTDSTTGWQVSDFFGDAGGPGNTSLAANGIYLVDAKNKKKHIVASDTGGKCVCSTDLSATFVRTGQSVVLTATFAAPPADVAAVDIHVPRTGTFRNVPIS